MAKSASQYQEGDVVAVRANVLSVSADGNIKIKLDTHLDGVEVEVYDGDLTLVKRPIKAGDPVKYGTRKVKFGTFQEEAVGGLLSVILVAGGKPDNPADYETIKTIELTSATADELQAAIHQAAGAPAAAE